ncbi:MAG: hypothetical protein MRY74_02240 [Neomegalonema sp.]|nr:hypothetical protein [Neomegalonema sp.]
MRLLTGAAVTFGLVATSGAAVASTDILAGAAFVTPESAVIIAVVAGLAAAAAAAARRKEGAKPVPVRVNDGRKRRN